MHLDSGETGGESVVPYAGTWIETFLFVRKICIPPRVVPYAGTWIETWYAERAYIYDNRRSLRGNVD